VQATFEVMASLPDPWANDVQFLQTPDLRDSVVVTFNPPGSCGLPDCSAIYLIQTVRQRHLLGPDTLCTPLLAQTYPDFSSTDLAKMQGSRTPGCTRIDANPGDVDPYLNGNDESDCGTTGRTGTNPAVSVACDIPKIIGGTLADTLLDEFEVDAYCSSGKNKGRYLGKTFWIYKATPGTIGAPARDPRRGPDLGPPTSEFLRADSLWREQHGVSQARPFPAAKGGTKCP